MQWDDRKAYALQCYVVAALTLFTVYLEPDHGVQQQPDDEDHRSRIRLFRFAVLCSFLVHLMAPYRESLDPKEQQQLGTWYAKFNWTSRLLVIVDNFMGVYLAIVYWQTDCWRWAVATVTLWICIFVLAGYRPTRPGKTNWPIRGLLFISDTAFTLCYFYWMSLLLLQPIIHHSHGIVP